MKSFLERKTAFLIILDKSNLLSKSELQEKYLMSVIIIKTVLLSEYKDYTNIFSEKETVKLQHFVNINYFIKLKLEKNLFYNSIYNLFATKLVVLQDYLKIN